MPDIIFATVLVIWTMNGEAGVIERSGPYADRATCEQSAQDLVSKHTDFYGQLPVTIEPRCEIWEPDLLRPRI